MNRHFSKEDIQKANKHVRRCSTSVVFRITMRYHFSTMTKIKKTITNVDEIGKKLEPYMLLLRM